MMARADEVGGDVLAWAKTSGKPMIDCHSRRAQATFAEERAFAAAVARAISITPSDAPRIQASESFPLHLSRLCPNAPSFAFSTNAPHSTTAIGLGGRRGSCPFMG
jgi:hypothetical protein